jgi:hypothetical protein
MKIIDARAISEARLSNHRDSQAVLMDDWGDSASGHIRGFPTGRHKLAHGQGSHPPADHGCDVPTTEKSYPGSRHYS